MKLILKLIYYASVFSVLIPIFYLLIYKNSVKGIAVKILGILIFISALSDLIIFILIRMEIPTVTIGNTYFVIQFFLMSYIFYHLLKNKELIYLGVVVYSILLITNTLFFQSFNEFQSWCRVAEDVIILTYVVSFYKYILTCEPPIDGLTHPPFWINSGVGFYFAFNLSMFLFSNYVFTNLSEDISMLFWSFHNANNIVKNLFFAAAVYFAGIEQPKRRSHKTQTI
jgi:hypothetical protein